MVSQHMWLSSTWLKHFTGSKDIFCFINCYCLEWGVLSSGGVSSPTLCSIFINDLVEDLRGLNLGIKIGESQIFALLYADDIVFFADSPEKLQQLIQHVRLWCDKRRLSINIEKTQIVHLRKTHPKLILYLYLMMSHLKSKYLGMVSHEHIDYNACVDNINQIT